MCFWTVLAVLFLFKTRAVLETVFCLHLQVECTTQHRVESYVTTDGQSASLSWNKVPIWGLRPDFCYCQTLMGLLMWGSLSDGKTGLSFTIAAGLRQSSHFRFRVPWDSRLYFTVSHSRLPFLSPPTQHQHKI
jgi:hypothetical protein